MNLRRLSTLGAVATWVAAAFGVCGGAMTSPVLAAESGWQANEDDSLLLEVRYGAYRFNDSVRGYQTPQGVCVDLADTIQTLDLPVRLDKKSRRATGWLFAEAETLTIDRDSNTVQTMNGRAPLAAGELYDTPEGWCVSLSALSKWLGVTLKSDLGNLAVTLETERKLPFLQAIERKSRAAQLHPRAMAFDLAQLPKANLPYTDWRTPAVDVTASSEWVRTPGQRVRADFRYEAYASGEVLGTSFDARLTSNYSGVPENLRLRAFRIDPDGNLLGPLKATEVSAGDVRTFASALTGSAAVGRGLFLTNRPPSRSARFAATTLMGELPAGWDAELYQNGQLIAWQSDRGDGRYEFADIELRYGDNALDVVLYGPQGQIRRQHTDYPVSAESIPVGQTWYWAGVLQQGRDLIDFGKTMADPHTGWRWGVGVERGIDKRTSLSIGAQSFILADRRRNYAELTLRRALGPMLVELGGAHQFGRGGGSVLEAQMIGRIGRFNLKGEALWVFGGYTSEVVTPSDRHGFGLGIDTDLKLFGHRTPIQGGLRQRQLRDGTSVTEWYARTSLQLRGLTLTAELDSKIGRSPRGKASDGDTQFRLLGSGRLGEMRVRGNATFRLSGPRQGFDTAGIAVERTINARSEIRGDVSYSAQNRAIDFSLGYVRQFNKFALRADARASTHGTLGLGLSLAMSFGADPVNGGWRMTSNKLAQFGEAAVTVFRDDNGDGVRQPGESGVDGVEIGAGLGLQQAKTNAAGRTVVDGMRPFVPVLLSIDESSVADPLLVPGGKGVVVVPRPGITARIELPLSPTGELEGTLIGSDGEPGQGVTLELVDPRGIVVSRLRTEFDGYFLFDRIPYGTYRLHLGGELSQGVERDLGLLVAITKAKPSIRAGTLRIARQPTSAGTVARN